MKGKEDLEEILINVVERKQKVVTGWKIIEVDGEEIEVPIFEKE